MDFCCQADLWEYLANAQKSIVMYGMGNGADKILAVCRERGIEVKDFFASDGFVRGHSFHGKQVLSWSEIKQKYGVENLIILLSFGTSRPEVLENIYRIAEEAELYAPDVPTFGNGLFDRAFFEENRDRIDAAYDLLFDDTSRTVFENVLHFKLTGRVQHLRAAENAPDEIMRELIHPERLTAYADLGAYNGDTVRELLLHASPALRTVWAMEPDARNFKKLQAYAESETRAKVLAVQAGAWSCEETLYFDASGNRNASFDANRSDTLTDRPTRLREVAALPLDALLAGARVDYIKYDVEGAEKEALLGSVESIRAHHPLLLVSLYHRNEDLFALPLLVHELFPDYKHFAVRRLAGVPAWDLNLYAW